MMDKSSNGIYGIGKNPFTYIIIYTYTTTIYIYFSTVIPKVEFTLV